MAARIADAHLVISRSGASTVSEIAVIGRPAILVPYPHALDHDQAANAARLRQRAAPKVHPQSTLSTRSACAELIGGVIDEPRAAGDHGGGAEVGRQAGRHALARRPDRGYCVGQDGC